jgi:hypothetical protein
MQCGDNRRKLNHLQRHLVFILQTIKHQLFGHAPPFSDVSLSEKSTTYIDEITSQVKWTWFTGLWACRPSKRRSPRRFCCSQLTAYRSQLHRLSKIALLRQSTQKSQIDWVFPPLRTAPKPRRRRAIPQLTRTQLSTVGKDFITNSRSVKSSTTFSAENQLSQRRKGDKGRVKLVRRALADGRLDTRLAIYDKHDQQFLPIARLIFVRH